MSMPVIMKVALDAVKARALAEKAGIIAHPQSNWKWALRQIRAKNPTGAYQSADDLILKGKELAKAKEKIGLLPNNARQKIKAISRKQKPGVEVAYTGKGRAIVGGDGHVGLIPGDTLDAHTHPTFARHMVNEKTRGGGLEAKEWARHLDEVLSASPSGTRWDAVPNPMAEKAHNRIIRDSGLSALVDKKRSIREQYYANAQVDQFGLTAPPPV